MQEIIKTNFLPFLESEINYLYNEFKRPGWSKWIIIASLSTILWLLIQEFQISKYNFDNIKLLLVVIFSTYGFIVLFHHIICWSSIYCKWINKNYKYPFNIGPKS